LSFRIQIFGTSRTYPWTRACPWRALFPTFPDGPHPRARASPFSTAFVPVGSRSLLKGFRSHSFPFLPVPASYPNSPNQRPIVYLLLRCGFISYIVFLFLPSWCSDCFRSADLLSLPPPFFPAPTPPHNNKFLKRRITTLLKCPPVFMFCSAFFSWWRFCCSQPASFSPLPPFKLSFLGGNSCPFPRPELLSLSGQVGLLSLGMVESFCLVSGEVSPPPPRLLFLTFNAFLGSLFGPSKNVSWSPLPPRSVDFTCHGFWFFFFLFSFFFVFGIRFGTVWSAAYGQEAG